MGKINRGNTIKLSIRLSSNSREKIQAAAKNLGISLGGVILFELTKILKNPPTLSHLKQLEKDITLENKHFVLTINEKLNERVNKLAEDHNMTKNILIGYIISDHFENAVDLNHNKDSEPRKIVVQVNESLKKKDGPI